MRRLAALLAAALPLLTAARDRPPDDLLASNMAECAFTALVRVDHAKVAQTLKDDKGRAGYVTIEFDVTVLESFAGTAHDAIVLYETAEAPAQPPKDGERFVVSFKLQRDGHFVVPDSGYIFPPDRDVIEHARQLGRRTLIKKN
jgi:hypothetical protein